MTRSLILALLISWFHGTIHCTEQTKGYTPLHSCYDASDGLPSNFVVYVFNDSRGLLWLGTDKGLSVFDGRSFQSIDFEEVADPFVAVINEDTAGTLWFATLDGAVYRLESNRAIPHPQASKAVELFNANIPPVSMSFRKNGSILMSNTIELIEVNDSNVRLLMDETQFKNSHFQTYDGHLQGVRSFPQLDSLRYSILLGVVRIDYQDSTNSIVPDRVFFQGDSNAFAIVTGAYLILYNRGVLKQLKFSAPISNSLFFESDSVLWLGTEGTGAYRIINGEVDKNLFPADRIYSICRDFEGGLFFGTGQSGLKHVAFEDSRLIRDPEGNPLQVRSISTYRDELRALCTDFSIYQNGRVRAPIMDEKKVFSANHDILETDEANYFSWRNQRGERRISRIDWNTLSISEQSSRAAYWKIFIDKGDTILGGHTHMSVAFAGRPLIKFIHPFLRVRQISRTTIEGDLWIVSKRGVVLLHVDSDRQTASIRKTYAEDMNPLFMWQMSSALVMASQNGHFYRLDTATSELTQLTELRSQHAECFVSLNESQMLVGTERGLILLETDEKGEINAREISKELGLLGHPVSDIALTSSHIYCLSLSQVFSLPRSILSQNFNDQGRLSFGQVSSGPEVLSPTEPIMIMTDEQLQVKLNAVSFKAKLDYQVEYRLWPLQTEWAKAHSSEFSFFNLPSDEYELQVRDEYGHQATLGFKVDSYFYERVWFIVLVIFICAVLLASPIYLSARFKTAAARLETEKNNLRLKALTSQLKPHFVFNALSSIQAYILRQDARASSDYLAKFAMHIRHALEHSNQDYISLESSLSSLRNYLDLERMRLQHSFDYTIQIDPEIHVERVYIPVMLIQPYVENAVMHGIAPKGEGGLIAIRLTRLSSNRLRCEIEDNGKGLPGPEGPQKSAKGNGLGTRINGERIRLLNALKKHHYEVSIHSNDSKPGVTVTLEIRFEDETH